MKVACDTPLVELFLNAVEDSHDAPDVSVEDVTDLQAFKSDLALIFGLLPISKGNCEALLCYVVYDRREPLMGRNVRGP